MKKFGWKAWFGAGLVLLSAALYGAHYLLFRDLHHILVYLVGDIAFVPIEVLLVTLVIHKLLDLHEKQAMLKKMNMAIGIFFSEMGTETLVRFQEFDTRNQAIRGDLCARPDGTIGDFDRLVKRYSSFSPDVDCRLGDMAGLKEYLVTKRQFMLGLLSNPNLLEHDSFTDLLWAVLHLSEELSRRQGFDNQSDADCAHLAGDVRRAYVLLVTEWISYMKHLQKYYPYLFSLAVRTNPFDSCAKVEVS